MKTKHIFSADTIPQYKIIDNILDSLNIDDERYLICIGYRLDKIDRCTILLTYFNEGIEKTYKYNEDTKKIEII